MECAVFQMSQYFKIIIEHTIQLKHIQNSISSVYVQKLSLTLMQVGDWAMIVEIIDTLRSVIFNNVRKQS